ncbi:MAG: sugar phosphate isomerase/epimerase family protein [Pirellulales bacterium]
MAEVKIGIQLASLRMPLKKALLTAARLGAHGVEIDARNDIRPEELTDTGRRQLKKLLEDLNLRVAAIRFHTARGFDTPENLERRMDGTKQAMRFAYSLGASVVVNQAGRVPESADSAAYHLMQQCLADLARYGQHTGAMFAAETGSEPGEQLAQMIGSLRETAVGITFNPGNLIANNFSVEDALPACSAYTLLVHAKDGVRDLARGRGVEVPLGRGTAEFPQIIATLEEHQFRGWYVIERDYSENIGAELASAIQFLKNL